MNPRLALLLAWRRLAHHPVQSLVTVLGVALGLTVAAAILIVDHNSSEQRIPQRGLADLNKVAPARANEAHDRAPKRILRVIFERQGETAPGVSGPGPGSGAGSGATPSRAPRVPGLPTQEGLAAGGVSAETSLPRRGEEDYQAMRLAVRLASLLAFAVGAVIVFYSMRFSVVSRARELMLLLCLGEARRNLGLSLTLEALLLGLAGTALGLAAGWWTGLALLDAGMSTTGRVPDPNPDLPLGELGLLTVLSLSIALLGVAGPLRALLRMTPVDVLQPRFLSTGPGLDPGAMRGLAWLLPPLMAATWLAARPFLQDWLTVIQFFLAESVVAALVGLAVLWWMTPVLRGAVRLVEWGLTPLLPFETLLAGRRLRLGARQMVLTIAAVTLVFSLVLALDGLTRALKSEIRLWASEALDADVFLRARTDRVPAPEALFEEAREAGLFPFRLSRKLPGEIPVRLIAAADANAYLAARGRPTLAPGRVLVSRTLAARFDLAPGDAVLVDVEGERFRFTVIGVGDDLGFFAEDGQYVDLKSWFLFDAASPLFAGNLSLSLGERLSVRRADGAAPSERDLRPFLAFYRGEQWGRDRRAWQTSEIDRDFAIFDFILLLTLALAAVGVANSLLIQVLGRQRELSLLRTLGVSRLQTLRLLLMEGAVIGAVGGLFALVLGHLFAAISIAFLDRFTLFDYRLSLDLGHALGILALSIVTCTLAALYPAMVANRVSSAESLHYE